MGSYNLRGIRDQILLHFGIRDQNLGLKIGIDDEKYLAGYGPVIVKWSGSCLYSLLNFIHFQMNALTFPWVIEEISIAPMHDYVRRVNFTNKPRL